MSFGFDPATYILSFSLPHETTHLSSCLSQDKKNSMLKFRYTNAKLSLQKISKIKKIDGVVNFKCMI